MEEKNRIKSACETIAKGAKGLLTWQWDKRFETAAAVLDVAQGAQVRELLEPALPWHWDSQTAASIPVPVHDLTAALGGLHVGQLVFASDKDNDIFVFGAWWPWNDGKRISLRIGAVWPGRTDLQKAELLALVRQSFGL
jgi:hypothetical protein